MKLTAQNIIIAAALIGIGYLIYRNYLKNKQSKTGTETQPGSGGTRTTTGSGGGTAGTYTPPPTAPQIDFNLLLKFGSNGEEVKTLQRYLNKKVKVTIGTGLTSNLQDAPLDIDGNFGNLTLTALQDKVGKTQTTLKELNIIDYLGNVNTNTNSAVNSNINTTTATPTNENWYETGAFTYAFWNWF